MVVGGSMAGLTAALELIRAGFKPTVYERRSDPRSGIVCAGGISMWGVGRSGLDPPKGTVAAVVRSVRIHAPSGHFWHGGGRRVLSYVMWRDRLEGRMSAEVRRLGGRVEYGRSLSPREVVSLSKDYDFTVGADGVLGATRAALGLPPVPAEDLHLGVQRLCSVPGRPPGRIDLYFGRLVAPLGYGWVFPVGRGRARVGLGVQLSERAKPADLLESLVEKVGAEPAGPVEAKIIPTTQPLRNPAFGDTLLVGDAGNFTDPFTGGGIVGAVASAKAAARAIAEGDPRRYRKHIGWLISQNKVRYRLKRVLCELTDAELDELVWAMQGLDVHPTRMSLNILRAILALALHKPRLLVRHKILRRMLGLSQ